MRKALEDTVPNLFLMVINEKEESVRGTFPIPRYYQREADALIEVYGVREKGDTRFIPVPEDCIGSWTPIYNGSSSPLPCLYTATRDFCEAILGTRLDASDRSFFDAHGLTTAEGTGASDTLRIVQEIIDPYGLFVSRIRVAPGFVPSGDLKQWMGVLGVNPFAVSDFTTSNKDFAAKLGMPLDKAMGMFRFEFSQEPLTPCISCGVLGSDLPGVVAGYAGGHATYRAPRAKHFDAMMQIQIAREAVWHGTPSFPAIPEKTLEYRPSMLSIKDPGGRVVSPKWGPLRPTSGSHKAHTPRPFEDVNSRSCFICGKKKEPGNSKSMVGVNCCRVCFETFLAGYQCSKCATPLRVTGNDYVRMRRLKPIANGHMLSVVCVNDKCKQEVEFETTMDDMAASVIIYSIMGWEKETSEAMELGKRNAASGNADA